MLPAHPTYCDGTTCVVAGGEPFAQASCPDRLEIGVEVTFKTLDGAVDAVAEGNVGMWAHGFEDVIGEGTADELHAHAQVDLGDVFGGLRLFPDASMPHAGVLSLQLDFLEDETRGYLWPTIIYGTDAGDASTPQESFWIAGVRYSPLEGTF